MSTLPTRSTWLPPKLTFLLLIVGWSPELAADQFRLEIPGDAGIQSTAVLKDGRLTIVTNGRGHVYEARPRYDSPEGDYRAYYSNEARQFVRWPVSGRGSMYIGQGSGEKIAWRRSLMQIVPIRDPVFRPKSPFANRPPQTAFRPEMPERDFRPDPRRPVERPAVETPHLAAVSDGRGNLTAALVDNRGNLQFYEGQQGRWRHRPHRVQTRLVPQAPLVLAGGRGPALPTVYTVGWDGSFVAVRDGQVIKLSGGRAAPDFPAGTHLARIQRGRETILFGVDRLGRVWEFDPGRSRFEPVESREGYFEPGSPITALRASEDRVYLIDLRGNLVEYHLRVDGWSRPTLVADGFPPSSPVAAAFLRVDDAPGAYLAAVDARGRLRVLHESREGWKTEVVDLARLAPLASLALADIRGRLSVSGVDTGGRWMQWRWHDGHWHERTIAEGFPAGSPVVMFSEPAVAIAVDHSQRLIPAQLLDGRWQCSICTPAVELAPRLVSRRVIPNPPLEPVTVNLVNSHDEPLIVQLYRLTDAGSPSELKIEPGGSEPVRIERDSGATLEEVYLQYDQHGQSRERVQRLPIAPRSLYTVVVNIERVTSVYFDRTRNKTSVPDKVSTSPVSLGTFRLPAGDALKQGDQLDVARQAAARRNPGARSLIEASRP